jgi:hypothetical protein
MLKLYYSAPIDTCYEEAFKEIAEFKELFAKFPSIEVYGAGFGESPIITQDTSDFKKGVVVSYDYRIVRGCDILFVNTNLKNYCAGTLLEMEYARQLGLYIILLVPEKPKNIFLTTLANKIVYSKKEVEELLKELC